MANKQDPRSARKKIKDAAYAALPPLRIHHPLRAIKQMFSADSWQVDAAKDLHRNGGNGLQEYAKSILS
jgi:hypothetical protein